MTPDNLPGGRSMNSTDDKPRIFHLLREDALGIRHSPFGSVGKIFSGEGIEVVWVKKQSEKINQGFCPCDGANTNCMGRFDICLD